MMPNELVVDLFERVKEVVHQVTDGLTIEQLAYQPEKSANSIAWLVWHLTRIQDDHIAGLSQTAQIWNETWKKKFNVPFDISQTGYGQSAADVVRVRVDSEALIGYYDAVHAKTIAYVRTLTQDTYIKVIDTHWKPPVTIAIRLISVVSDDLQHAGQAAYIRGLLEETRSANT
jgi:Protein of unknown function (DUF664)